MLTMFSKYDKEVKGGLTAEQLKIGTRQYLKLQMNDHQGNGLIHCPTHPIHVHYPL